MSPANKGELNEAITRTARQILSSCGKEIKTTSIQSGYDPAVEVEKFTWADAVLFHTPVYWFYVPWLFKKYIDDVFNYRDPQKRRFLYRNDGRDRNGEGTYGTGGLLTDTKFMLVTTWNAPKEAFDVSNPLIRGNSVSDCMRPFYLMAEFIGMKPLPGFAFFDVHKTQDKHSLQDQLDEFASHLRKSFE